ncbi:MAG: S8 family serine peptidase [Geminicoccaceae bacterium]
MADDPAHDLPSLIASVPRDPAGLDRRTSEALHRKPFPVPGIVHEWELTNLLGRKGIGNLNYAFQLPAYHRLRVVDGDIYGAIAKLLRHFASPESPDGFLRLVEPDRALRIAAGPSTALGQLDLSTGSHAAYLEALGVTDGQGKPTTGGIDGSGVTVLVVDSGSDANELRNPSLDFRDLVDDPPASAVDNSGHGTAMIKLIRAVAPQARICAVRVFDTGSPELSNVMAGIIAGLAEFNPDVVSLSLGFPDLKSPCTICGSHAGNRSTMFQNLFTFIERLANAGGNPDPVIVAATGNDHPNIGMYFPAAYTNDSILGVGAITSGKQRSTFSNFDKSSGFFTVLPGGDWDYHQNKQAEWVAEGKDASGNVTSYCVGTSPAAAYAAGLMALYRQQIPRRGGSSATSGGAPQSAAGGAANLVDEASRQCVTLDLSPKHLPLEHGAGRLVFKTLTAGPRGGP